MSYKKTVVVGFSLFGLVVLTALSTFYVSLGDCPSGSMSCDNGTKCIPPKLVCNFDRECQDGKDEDRKWCGNHYGSFRNSDEQRVAGFKKNLELMAMYNYSNYIEMWNRCSDEIIQELPPKCTCKRINMVVCFNRTRLPAKIPSSAEILRIENGQLAFRSSDTFTLNQNLSYLMLGFNNISTPIPSELFKNMTRLRKLDMSKNSIRDLPRTLFSSLESLIFLFLNDNRLGDFDLSILLPLKKLKWLNLSNNNLTLDDATFPQLPELIDLELDHNRIKHLRKDLFGNLHHLELIALRFNDIEVIEASTFSHLHQLLELRLNDNPIQRFDSELFQQLPHLQALFLDNVKISIDEKFLSHLNVSMLSVNGISGERIDFKAVARIESLKSVIFWKFHYCFAERSLVVKTCLPKTDGLSSNMDLLKNPIHRFAALAMAILTCIGNSMVLWGRFKFHDENRSVSMVIRNLALSDLLMSCYLGIISYKDYQHRENYHEVASDWIQSWGCAFAGMLSMISSEVTILILTFMSIERFLLISDPFGHHRLNTKNVLMSLYVIWLVGVSIAILPAILLHSSTKFYGIYNGGTCFPLFIIEKYPSGWFYSAFVFLGINFSLLALIASLYSALLISIWRTRRATTLDFFDCEFAIRFFFIVLTDSTCWAPIIVLKVLALTDIEFSSDAYAWLVIFALPLNSAVNPLLFTFSTPKYRDQIYKTFSRQSFIKKQDSTSNQATADDSQTKVLPAALYSSISCSSSSSSKWMFMRKKS